MTQVREPFESYQKKEIAQLKELIKQYKENYRLLSGDPEIESQKIQIGREKILLLKQQLSEYENKVARAFHSVQSLQEHMAKIGVNAKSEVEVALESVSNAFQHVDAIRTQIQETEDALNHYDIQIKNKVQSTKLTEKQYLGSIEVVSNSMAQLEEEGQPQAHYDQAREQIRLQKQAIKESRDTLDFSTVDVMEAKQFFSQSVELSKNTLGHLGSEIQNAMAPVDKIRAIKEIFLMIYALNHAGDDLNEIQLKVSELNDVLRKSDANVLDMQLMFSGQLTTVRSEIEKSIEFGLKQQEKPKILSEQTKEKNPTQLENEAEVKSQRQRLASAQHANIEQKSHENQLKNKPILDAFLKLLHDEIERIQKGSAIYKQKKINNLKNLIAVVKALEGKNDLNLKKEFDVWTQDSQSAYSQVIHRSHAIHRFFQMENQSHVAIQQFFNETYPKLMASQTQEMPVNAEEKVSRFALGGRRSDGG